MQRDLVYLSIIAVLAYLAFSNNFNNTHVPASEIYSSTSNLRVLERQNSSSVDALPQPETPFIVEEDTDDPKTTTSDSYFWVSLSVSIVLVLFGGTMSGLTVGYLSIDELQLELKMENGTEEEKKDASIIIPILSKHHLLLCTLLLANAFAMEALPLFLDAIMPAFAAIIVSTSAVVVFGEIVPQAYCTGPNQIKIARRMAPLIKILIILMFPICYPISLILDKILGTHQKTRFVKKDLKTLIQLHRESVPNSPENKDGESSSGEESDDEAQLTLDEVKVINSTIDLRETPVTKEMESIERVFMIAHNEIIDKELLQKISRAGFSKVPVYKNGNRNHVMGFIRVKTLLEYDKYEGKSLEESGVHLKAPLVVAKDTSMLEMLMLFQERRTGIALVCDDSAKEKETDGISFSRNIHITDDSNIKLVGLISLKDIFEEILESKMMDDDVHHHPHHPHHIPLARSGSNRLKKKTGEDSSPRSPRKKERSPPPVSRRQMREATMPATDLTRRLLDPSNP